MRVSTKGKTCWKALDSGAEAFILTASTGPKCPRNDGEAGLLREEEAEMGDERPHTTQPHRGLQGRVISELHNLRTKSG